MELLRKRKTRSEKSNIERNERIDNHHNGEIRNPSEILKKLCIPSLLGEIECYPKRVEKTNIIILLS